MKKLTSFILSVLLCASMLAALPQAFCCDEPGVAPASMGAMNLGEPELGSSAAPDEGSEPEQPLRPNAPGHNGESH